VGARQLVRELLQYPQVRVFLLILGGLLLGAIVQSGLLGPLLVIGVVGIVVWLTRRQLVRDALLSPILEKLLLGDIEGKQDYLVEEHAQAQSFACIKTLDDLRLLTPSEFEMLVGDVMQHMGYAQVEVVGRSRDLCVDVKAIGPNGGLVAVQCKRYTKRNVNSDEMQKFIGMIYLHHRADKGMYFTTSSYTKDARKLGEDNRIELIDGERLIKIIRDLAPDLV
jgi:hypothetical protein